MLPDRVWNPGPRLTSQVPYRLRYAARPSSLRSSMIWVCTVCSHLSGSVLGTFVICFIDVYSVLFSFLMFEEKGRGYKDSF